MVEEAWALYMQMERLYLAAPRFSPEEQRFCRLMFRARERWARRAGLRPVARKGQP